MIGFKETDVNIYIVDDDVLLLKILDNKFKKQQSILFIILSIGLLNIFGVFS